MEVIDNYEDALKIGKVYIDHLKVSSRAPIETYNNSPLPQETQNKKWSLSLQALKNTLEYIFKKLHHPCYMLCIMDNTYVMYKFKMATASPTFEKAIKTRHVPMLKKNKLIKPYQKEFILKSLQNPVRILQCILKIQTGKQSTDEPKFNEYNNVIYNMKLPNGVFIFNLTDAVILTNDGTEPFPMVTGRLPLGKYDFNEYLPIMSMSGQIGYADIPIPNYDDISIIYNDAKLAEFDTFNTSWNDKKIKKAVFRGGPSGCGYTSQTNMRVKLALMKSNYLDVGLSGKGKNVDSRSIKFDPVYGLGMLNTGIKPASFLSMVEQSNYKYIIHIDGNVNAYRLLTTMRTGSLILRVNSAYRSWVDHMIYAGIHYLPIKSDLSDLESCIEWCIKNDDKCKLIAKNGLDFAISVLKKDYIKSYFQKVLWSLSDYQDTFTQPSSVYTSPQILEYSALNKKRCSKGYRSTTVKNKKLCKKHNTTK